MNQPEQHGKTGSDIPQNDPSRAMDSKREVEQSPDPKTDQDFPGYPHYPAREDIMDERTDSHRVDTNIEDMPANKNNTGVSERYKNPNGNQDKENNS